METERRNTSLMDSLSAAFGGRRIAGLLWSCWVFGAMCGWFLADPSVRHPFRGRVGGVLFQAIILFAILAICLVRACLSDQYRAYLLGRVPAGSNFSDGVRFFVRAIPFLVFLPFLARWYFSQ